MKIMTWPTSNFGDRLNDIVWPALLPNLVDANSDELLVGIGSLLNHRLPQEPIKHILGAGFGHGGAPRRDHTWRIHWVRGPLTANVLDIDPDFAIVDSAVLIRLFLEKKNDKTYKCSFIPHTSAIKCGTVEILKKLCNINGINFINPHWPVMRVIDEIGSSEKVISEALHGAIIADSLRVPWKAVTRKGVFSFKWEDWAASVECSYKPSLLPYRPRWFATEQPTRLSRKLSFPVIKPISTNLLSLRLKHLVRDDGWNMSEEKTLIEKIKRLEAIINNMNKAEI